MESRGRKSPAVGARGSEVFRDHGSRRGTVVTFRPVRRAYARVSPGGKAASRRSQVCYRLSWPRWRRASRPSREPPWQMRRSASRKTALELTERAITETRSSCGRSTTAVHAELPAPRGTRRLPDRVREAVGSRARAVAGRPLHRRERPRRHAGRAPAPASTTSPAAAGSSPISPSNRMREAPV